MAINDDKGPSQAAEPAVLKQDREGGADDDRYERFSPEEEAASTSSPGLLC
jgi:hypothetical protein